MRKVLFAFLILITKLFTLSAFTDKNTIIVSKDGKGNFTRISDAIASVPDNNTSPIIIYVKNGIYKEKLIISKSKNKYYT